MKTNLLQIATKYGIPLARLRRAYLNGEIFPLIALPSDKEIETWIITKGIKQFFRQEI